LVNRCHRVHETAIGTEEVGRLATSRANGAAAAATPRDYGLVDAGTDPEGSRSMLELGPTEGMGVGDGEAKSELGRPTTERTTISTTMAMTAMTHGRASASLRGGRAPR
jgi:hypothetical protein